MKKSIEVIIKTKDIYKNPSQRIKKVSVGYAFNYLIPNRIAELATKGKIKHLNMLQNLVAKKNNKLLAQNIKIQKDLEKITVLYIRKKCSQNNQIFGSISEQDIITKILQITGINIDKKQIEMLPIKQIGEYDCNIKIDEQISSQIDIHIIPNEI